MSSTLEALHAALLRRGLKSGDVATGEDGRRGTIEIRSKSPVPSIYLRIEGVGYIGPYRPDELTKVDD